MTSRKMKLLKIGKRTVLDKSVKEDCKGNTEEFMDDTSPRATCSIKNMLGLENTLKTKRKKKYRR